ncbi:MAG: ZIP family metal transporter [Eubacterium sp.]|nr:ZIP family metal transporter [Eubacterium sp.]
MNYPVLYSLLATLGTWMITALGAAVVLFFKEPKRKHLNLMLGFSAGVMIAASFFSLLEPAITQAEQLAGLKPCWIVFSGFLIGSLFMVICDRAVGLFKKEEKSNTAFMLIMSITLHNIPEGLAIGVAFGALGSGEISNEALMGAVTIALGIGIQNFPEGAAVSLPLRREGKTRLKSFLWGQASALVEPVSGLIGSALVIYVKSLLPYALSFAAGAMILVAVHELIPACQKNKGSSYFSTLGIISGFSIMMLLDVMLG